MRIINLSYSYGANPIYKGANFNIANGDKVGLVGNNGAGKSTLFNLITGKLEPDEGKIETHGVIMAVPQEVKRDAEMEAAKSISEYMDPKNKFEDYEIRRMIARLELVNLDLDDSPQVLSGGQKTKLAIARALLQQPDILLLDEPTNFLDIEGKKWMMGFLSKYPKTLIIVSHDMELLDQNINRILEINSNTKKIDEYVGNYSNYVKLKAENEEVLMHHIKTETRVVEEMKKKLLKHHKRSEKGVRQELNIKHRVEKMIEALPEMPPEAKKIRMVLPEPAWVGSMPILAEHISKTFGEKKVLRDASFNISRGERVALMGQNGVGKSTLIKILMGMTKPDEGEVLIDEQTKIGYYSQEFENFDFNATLYDSLKEKAPMTETAVRTNLGKFLFTGPKVFQKVGSLSGGEKTRLSIAMLLVQNFNLLILDEPTTYLDVLSQRLILEALKSYKGAMLVVSHTPEFINELKPSRKFYLPENKWELCEQKI